MSKKDNFDPLDVKSRYGSSHIKKENIKASILDKITDKIGVVNLLILLIILFFGFLATITKFI